MRVKRWSPAVNANGGAYMVGDKEGKWAWADEADERIAELEAQIATRSDAHLLHSHEALMEVLQKFVDHHEENICFDLLCSGPKNNCLLCKQADAALTEAAAPPKTVRVVLRKSRSLMGDLLEDEDCCPHGIGFDEHCEDCKDDPSLDEYDGLIEPLPAPPEANQ